MKRFFSTILAILYLTFSAGATMHLHYCMGELAGISLRDTNSGACEKCGMESHDAKNDCCKDVPVSVKITDDQAAGFFEYTFGKSWMQQEATFSPSYNITLSLQKEANRTTPTFYPLLGPSAPLFLINRNLRI